MRSCLFWMCSIEGNFLPLISPRNTCAQGCVIEQTLADPNLTQAEAEFLRSVPDLFKASLEDFEICARIIERSLERRGWNRPLRILPPTYH